MASVIASTDALPVGGSSDVGGEILAPAGFELLELRHTLQPDYFFNPDMEDPSVKAYFEVDIKNFLETGEGTRQQLYVARKI
eukprot:gnl/Chilomastix_caulleri/401.p2 GENE.gnl/Chilomastix_caulleri/401~~gnl/Chilomastix_caulleri/401.p2  ORF type:complete len:82 (+),score=21.51 gnl/Chilomastix_caulleri/401:687-932(+)